jgi:HSP20 family protein
VPQFEFLRSSPIEHQEQIDIAESKDAIDVTAELPGVDEKDLDVTLANGNLTIRGKKRTERDEQDEDKNWHLVERSYGSFSRALPRRRLTPKISAASWAFTASPLYCLRG